MIRKTALISFILLFVSFGLMAAHVAIAPYNGAYGVNMASYKYQGDKHIEVGYRWGKYGDQDNPASKFEALSGEESKKVYLDEHMIGVGGLYNLSGATQQNTATRYQVTATCTNGFYFKSQSNPNIMRPFEILIVARYRDRVTDRVVTDRVEALKSSGQSETFYYKGSGTHIWFDLVLALPLDVEPVPGSNYVIVNGQRYSLVQANDYTALVSINVTAWDSKGDIIDSETVNIPFSGYFDGDVEGRHDDRLSLMFTPNANAGNLNILTQNSQYIPVGNIDFLLNAHNSGISNPENYVKIFFSSSNEPDDATAQNFRFVHSSVEPSTALTNYNSIGYEILVMGDNGASSARFLGSDHLDGNGQISNAITPMKVTAEITHQGNRDFYQYSGQINVFIHEPETVMLPGDYHDRVYVHVVTDSGVN